MSKVVVKIFHLRNLDDAYDKFYIGPAPTVLSLKDYECKYEGLWPFWLTTERMAQDAFVRSQNEGGDHSASIINGRSTSVGDVIQVHETYYLVCPIGFNVVTME